MPNPYTGRCVCGGIRYQLNAEPLTLYACHCAYCQAQSGSAFGLSMPVPWVRIPEGVLVFPGQPEDDRELVRAWRKRHG